MLKSKKKKKSEAGFVAAEFLFSFVLVISCGIIVFALTFSLMTIEVAQYITWSAARSYSAANKTKGDSEAAAREKFRNLSAAFPLLTDSEWFELTATGIGKNASSGMNSLDPNNRLGEETRHPWSGVSSSLDLKLFKSLRIPFLGNVTNKPEIFGFPLRAFILRNPSQDECMQFFNNRYGEIKNLPDFQNLSTPGGNFYVPHEDNGC